MDTNVYGTGSVKMNTRILPYFITGLNVRNNYAKYRGNNEARQPCFIILLIYGYKRIWNRFC